MGGEEGDGEIKSYQKSTQDDGRWTSEYRNGNKETGITKEKKKNEIEISILLNTYARVCVCPYVCLFEFELYN